MIVGSVLLVAGAAVLLLAGLVRADAALLGCAIGLSALAAAALLLGTRRLAATRLTLAVPVRLPLAAAASLPVVTASVRPAGSVPPRPAPPRPVGRVTAPALLGLAGDVEVVDGQPRYHVPDCAHVSSPSRQTLPVAEAVELGFTPCAACRPADALLAAAQDQRGNPPTAG